MARRQKDKPAVPVSRIHSPTEEINLLEEQIQSERDLRKSLKLRTRPEYIQSQKEYLQAQIDMFQAKLDTLLGAEETLEEDIAASFTRQSEAQKRVTLLRNRGLIQRFLKVQAKVNDLNENIAMDEETLEAFADEVTGNKDND